MPYTLRSDAVLMPHGEPSRASVHIDGAHIAAGPGSSPIDLGDHIIAPGFVDLQVNGGGDVLFNDEPTVASIEAIVAAHTRYGTTTLLPTFMTGPIDGMHRAAEAAAQLARSPTSGVGGVHFEGPVFSPNKLGIHDSRYRKDKFPTETLVAGLPTLVTLAPEIAGPGGVRELTERGVKVAVGHSDATAAETAGAIDAGATLATHLFNAMSQFGSRQPGVTGTFMSRDDAWVDFICDGQHVDFASLRVATRAKPRGQCLLVTDAMPPLGGERRAFALGNRRATAENGACWLEDGTLAGSALDLASAVHNCVSHLGISAGDALRMASTWPARYMGLADRGEIAPGRRADLTILSPALEVQAVIRAGSVVHDPSSLLEP